jgi:hypothetical protein
MPRGPGVPAVPSREEIVMRAFELRRPLAPKGWGSARELLEAIAEVLHKPKTSSTVRETWRVARDSLRKKAYLSEKLFPTPGGPEIRYALRVVDRKISIPADQLDTLTQEDRERLFPPQQLSKLEESKRRRELGDALVAGLNVVQGVFLAGASTADLERELLSRLDPPTPEPPSRFAMDHPDDLKLRAEFARRPSAEFAIKLYEAVKGSAAPPSTRSTGPQTPTPRRASSGRRRRGTPARSASPGRRRHRAS